MSIPVIHSNRWQETVSMPQSIAALFKNMGILKFKSQLTFAFFVALNHLSRYLSKQNLTGSKGHWFAIGWFRSALCVSVVHRLIACYCNYTWWQQKIQLWRRLFNLRVRIFVKSAVNNKTGPLFLKFNLRQDTFKPLKEQNIA